jgi:hypothetical protein
MILTQDLFVLERLSETIPLHDMHHMCCLAMLTVTQAGFAWQ